MLFELDNVELYFKNKPILNGIYLKTETGNITSVLGRNGCGKSCLLDIVFGNLKAKYKLLRINNKPILKPLYKTTFVKYLPQYHFIPNRLKLKTAFKLFKVSWDDFSRQFEDFTKLEYKKFGVLSGGERRLVETYLVLKSDSKLVLLDEPFSHLAPKHIEAIKAILSEEKESKAIIITDHYYQHVLDISKTIYLLNNGNTQLIKNLIELEDYGYLNSGSLNQ